MELPKSDGFVQVGLFGSVDFLSFHITNKLVAPLVHGLFFATCGAISSEKENYFFELNGEGEDILKLSPQLLFPDSTGSFFVADDRPLELAYTFRSVRHLSTGTHPVED